MVARALEKSHAELWAFGSAGNQNDDPGKKGVIWCGSFAKDWAEVKVRAAGYRILRLAHFPPSIEKTMEMQDLGWSPGRKQALLPLKRRNDALDGGGNRQRIGR